MVTREEAESLLRKYNPNEALVYHAFCVEETMADLRPSMGTMSNIGPWWACCMISTGGCFLKNIARKHRSF
jgi:predicted hydrolase (HD superfamily)